jgi:hypothetical protein
LLVWLLFGINITSDWFPACRKVALIKNRVN